MTLSEQLIQFVRHTFDTILYFAIMLVKENLHDYITDEGTVGEPKGAVMVLGNGPSLKEDLPKIIERGDHLHKDLMCVNYFAEDPLFATLRPKYYVLSDPKFFRQNVQQERIMRFYKTLNERVTWQMNLYVQYYNPEHFDYRKVLPNPNIRIIPFHTQVYHGFQNLEFWLFDRGLGSANYGTVVQVCEYVALVLGYKQVELFGVDHTLLNGLCVDEHNRLCRVDAHYYDDKPAEPTPMYQNVPHRPYTMTVYLTELAELFRGHEVLRDYAEHCGARIINRTHQSMIDAYDREPLA